MVNTALRMLERDGKVYTSAPQTCSGIQRDISGVGQSEHTNLLLASCSKRAQLQAHALRICHRHSMCDVFKVLHSQTQVAVMFYRHNLLELHKEQWNAKFGYVALLALAYNKRPL